MPNWEPLFIDVLLKTDTALLALCVFKLKASMSKKKKNLTDLNIL